jgi:hypothetical protein
MQVGTFAVLLSLLFCGFMMNQESVPAIAKPLHWLSYFAQAYELLVVGEFDHNPAQFTFTARVRSLPPLRVSGAGVLAQFGYKPGRSTQNFFALLLFSAACAVGTYLSLLLVHPDIANKLSSLFGRVQRNSRYRPLYHMLGPVLGDSVMRILDPNVFPEESIAPTPRTALSSLADLRASDSSDLGEVLGLSSPPCSPTAERRLASSKAAMPAVLMHNADDEGSVAVPSGAKAKHSRRGSRLPSEAGASEASTVEMMHSQLLSMRGSQAGTDEDAKSAKEEARRHVRSFSTPQAYYDWSAHGRTSLHASGASRSGQGWQERNAEGSLLQSELAQTSARGEIIRPGHLLSISTTSAPPLKAESVRASEKGTSTLVSATAVARGERQSLLGLERDVGGMEVMDGDLARDANVGDEPQHAHAHEQHHHERRTLSWHGLNVSVKLWNGMFHMSCVLWRCSVMFQT